MGLSLASTASTLESAGGPVTSMLGTVFEVGVAEVALEVPKMAKNAFLAVFGDAFEPVAQAPKQQAAPPAPAPAWKM